MIKDFFHKELAQVILLKYRQGAIVRIITDTEYMNLKGSQMHSFQIEGNRTWLQLKVCSWFLVFASAFLTFATYLVS